MAEPSPEEFELVRRDRREVLVVTELLLAGVPADDVLELSSFTLENPALDEVARRGRE